MTGLPNRYRGAIVGLATGDALGAAVEFCPPGSFPPVTAMRGGGPHGLRAGYWTDDTSMALCLAESLLTCTGFYARDQMERYVRWWRDGYMSSTGRCFDIGNTVRAALERFLQNGEPFAGSTDEWSAGNGSLMRLAPVPLFYRQHPGWAIGRAADSSQTTHANRVAVDACRYMTALMIGALNGASREELLSPLYAPEPRYWDTRPLARPIHEIASGSFRKKSASQVQGSGYVAHTLEAALWAFHDTDTFRDGALRAVNLGDDADTTGAVYGQLAGAYYGMEAIPHEWVAQLAQLNVLLDVADRLHEASHSVADAHGSAV